MPTWGCSYKQGKSCTSSTSSSSEFSDSTCTSTSNTSQARTCGTLQGRGRWEVEQNADCCSSSIPTRPSSCPAWCSRPTQRPSAAGKWPVLLGWRHLVGEGLGQQGRRGMVVLEEGHRMGQVGQQSSILAACIFFVFQTFSVTQSLYRLTINLHESPYTWGTRQYESWWLAQQVHSSLSPMEEQKDRHAGQSLGTTQWPP